MKPDQYIKIKQAVTIKWESRGQSSRMLLSSSTSNIGLWSARCRALFKQTKTLRSALEKRLLLKGWNLFSTTSHYQIQEISSRRKSRQELIAGFHKRDQNQLRCISGEKYINKWVHFCLFQKSFQDHEEIVQTIAYEKLEQTHCSCRMFTQKPNQNISKYPQNFHDSCGGSCSFETFIYSSQTLGVEQRPEVLGGKKNRNQCTCFCVEVFRL